MEERLQKIIALRGGMSRRAAEKLIASGQVRVNGRTAELGEKAGDGDEITVRGDPLPAAPSEKQYIMLNKPVGYVTTMSDEKGRKTVAALVSDLGRRVYPVGRLDMDSDGLLLMTDDGAFANAVAHPSFEKDKTYRVAVSGPVAEGAERLRQPMELDGVRLRTPNVRVVSAGKTGVLEITIHEGKNRQVRRMCAAAGLGVLSLTRISVGQLRLGDLEKGRWRRLTPGEVEALMCKK